MVVMARKLRIQYPGAVYHVMSRGNQGGAIFQGDSDRKVFPDTLAEGCENPAWRRNQRWSGGCGGGRRCRGAWVSRRLQMGDESRAGDADRGGGEGDPRSRRGGLAGATRSGDLLNAGTTKTWRSWKGE